MPEAAPFQKKIPLLSHETKKVKKKKIQGLDENLSPKESDSYYMNQKHYLSNTPIKGHLTTGYECKGSTSKILTPYKVI